MEQTVEKKPRKKIPPLVKWLLGYVGTLGAAAGLVYYWRVVFFTQQAQLPALPITLGVAAVFSLLYLLVFLACRFFKQNICLKAAVCVLVLGLLFCFATPPMQTPDEQFHYLRAYSISNGHFTYDANRTYPDDVTKLVQSFPSQMNFGVCYQGGELAETAFANYQAALQSGPAATPLTEQEALVFVSIPMLPQAAGMLVGRLFGLGALGLLYAGRIGNLLFYALVCYFVFKNCNKYRGVFFAVAMLPLSLSLAASCSYDSTMLAMCYLAVSYFCKDEIQTKDVWVFGLAVLLATYIKPMNFVLVAVLLLIPKARWKTKTNPWAAFGIIMGASLTFYGLMAFVVDASWLKFNYGELWRGSGDGAAPLQQLFFVVTNIPAFVSRVLLTLYEEAAFIFNMGTFGTLDMTIPLVSGLSVLSLAAASALGIQQKEDTKAGGAWGLFLAAVLYACAIIAGLYVLQNDLYSIRINQLQPRYFLPAFLLLFMLASILLGKAVRPRLAAGDAATLRVQNITLYIAASVALLAVILIFQGYFIGQWLPKLQDGTHKLVNLYGWMIQ
ncbi:DUF2142 domain-containing protein [Ruminococcaceae bacterium OttesenSCG-928-A16]|nr:DUF2142 domain-containing protein [Ruminococcaceae bacterium OttesenSCG-928-A16]